MGKVRTEMKYAENVATVIALIIPVAILAKLIEHLLLPPNYFYDSTRILNMSLGNNGGAWEGSYRITSDLFSSINYFNFSSLLEWSIFAGIIFNIVLIIFIKKIKSMDMLQSIFALMCIGLCNIYIFNICKDIIQFSLFLICFVLISIDRIPNIVKVLGCALVFYWESTFFRNYYIIMAAFTIGVYIIIWIVRKNKLKLNF